MQQIRNEIGSYTRGPYSTKVLLFTDFHFGIFRFWNNVKGHYLGTHRQTWRHPITKCLPTIPYNQIAAKYCAAKG